MKSELAFPTTPPMQDEILELPLHRNFAFSNHKGIYKKSAEKRQRGLLSKLSCLKPFLKENEKISLVTTGCSPASVMEQLLTGWILYFLKRSLLVFTDKRILHIPTKMNYTYKDSIAQISYQDLKSIRLKGAHLICEYGDGQKEKFSSIGSQERKKIKLLLEGVHLGGAAGQLRKRSHLCPRCTNELEKDRCFCPTCNLKFKSQDDAKRISIIYPGGGYFYTGHPILGIEDALFETLLIFGLLFAIADFIRGTASGFNLIFFALALTLEKLISVYHSNHYIDEFIPKERSVQIS